MAAAMLSPRSALPLLPIYASPATVAPTSPPPLPICRRPFSSSISLSGHWVSRKIAAFRVTGYRVFAEESDDEEQGFDQAVHLFNSGDYYRCHDFLEELWHEADEPSRTLIHGILQCAVGFHHLFNQVLLFNRDWFWWIAVDRQCLGQNHRGAMMQLGEGLGKLRKMKFNDGPFLQFEREISVALEFIYQTQKELAACTDDLCITMDGSERSYQLLGSFAAGQRLYGVETDPCGSSYITFDPEEHYTVQRPERVKIPTLLATEEHLKACENSC